MSLGLVVVVISVLLQTRAIVVLEGEEYFLSTYCPGWTPQRVLGRHAEGIWSGGYYATNAHFYQALSTEPHLHEYLPKETLFVPFDLDVSFSVGTKDDCDPPSHLERVDVVLEALDKLTGVKLWPFGSYRGFDDDRYLTPQQRSHTSFKRTIRFSYKGFNLVEAIQVPDDKFLKSHTLETNTRARWVWKDIAQIAKAGKDWPCIVPLPIVTHKHVRYQQDETFEAWLRRPIQFYYRGAGRMPHPERPAFIRTLLVNTFQNLSNSLISTEHADTKDQFRKELLDSRFCLIARGDDPQTSRFYDAIQSGCIPVLINEGFMPYVAPFSRLINYSTFTIILPESLFMDDPSSVVAFLMNIHPSTLIQLWEGLKAVRPVLLWQHPKSQTPEYALRAAVSDCAHVFA